jgi:hypothetical protein
VPHSKCCIIELSIMVSGQGNGDGVENVRSTL